MRCSVCDRIMNEWKLIDAENRHVIAHACGSTACSRYGLMVIHSGSEPKLQGPMAPRSCPRHDKGAHMFRQIAGGMDLFCMRCGIKIQG